MRPVLIVPGISNSGPDHWQSLWEAAHPQLTRVQQRDWDHPVRDTWVAAFDAAVGACAEPPIVVAHSLGCLVVAHAAAAGLGPRIHAALLVAVPDPTGPNFPREAMGFAPLPDALPIARLCMVSSRDDPYSSADFTRHCAARWQARHVELGAHGHLNAASGLGAWPQAWAWVQAWRDEG